MKFIRCTWFIWQKKKKKKKWRSNSIKNVESLKWEIGAVSFVVNKFIRMICRFEERLLLLLKIVNCPTFGQKKYRKASIQAQIILTFSSKCISPQIACSHLLYYLIFFFVGRTAKKHSSKYEKEFDSIAMKIGWNGLWNYFSKLCQSMRWTKTDTISL